MELPCAKRKLEWVRQLLARWWRLGCSRHPERAYQYYRRHRLPLLHRPQERRYHLRTHQNPLPRHHQILTTKLHRITVSLHYKWIYI